MTVLSILHCHLGTWVCPLKPIFNTFLKSVTTICLHTTKNSLFEIILQNISERKKRKTDRGVPASVF